MLYPNCSELVCGMKARTTEELQRSVEDILEVTGDLLFFYYKGNIYIEEREGQGPLVHLYGEDESTYEGYQTQIAADVSPEDLILVEKDDGNGGKVLRPYIKDECNFNEVRVLSVESRPGVETAVDVVKAHKDATVKWYDQELNIRFKLKEWGKLRYYRKEMGDLFEGGFVGISEDHVDESGYPKLKKLLTESKDDNQAKIDTYDGGSWGDFFMWAVHNFPAFYFNEERYGQKVVWEDVDFFFIRLDEEAKLDKVLSVLDDSGFGLYHWKYDHDYTIYRYHRLKAPLELEIDKVGNVWVKLEDKSERISDIEILPFADVSVSEEDFIHQEIIDFEDVRINGYLDMASDHMVIFFLNVMFRSEINGRISPGKERLFGSIHHIANWKMELRQEVGKRLRKIDL